MNDKFTKNEKKIGDWIWIEVRLEDGAVDWDFVKGKREKGVDETRREMR